jgi:uncharacterized protein (UPF0276 family)
LCTPNPGFGLGLRTPHYPDFQRQRQPLDWLEVITDNFLVEGGRPLKMLDFIRRDYPLVMHGVAMSLGSADGLNLAYVQQVKQLAQRVQPLWVSDHLCWSGLGNTVLHDLNPLPYTDEAARRLIAHITQAQDLLQRRLVVENVSSYVSFAHSGATEWEFLSHVAQEADCLLLVDVNNIYVSAFNHGFDPLDYLNALPAHRVQQIHLAGHSRNPTHIIDTHDHPVCSEVWDIYAAACRRFGAVATMIERDDHIPPLPELLAELDQARAIAQANVGTAANVIASVAKQSPVIASEAKQSPPIATDAKPSIFSHCEERERRSNQPEDGSPRHFVPRDDEVVSRCRWKRVALGPELLALQQDWVASVLQDTLPEEAPTLLSLAQSGSDTAHDRLGIYHRAYRLRLCEVLRDSFAKTSAYMGELFDQHASEFAVAQPPALRNLGRYGASVPAFLQQTYPDNPELAELAQLDWDLRSRFDGADAPASGLDALQPNAEGNIPCLTMSSPLHPSVVLRNSQSNAVKLWRAIDDDTEVPEVQLDDSGAGLVVWRWDLQPHFMRLDAAQYRFMQALAEGSSIHDAAQNFADTEVLPTPEVLGAWLQSWLSQGLLRASFS